MSYIRANNDLCRPPNWLCPPDSEKVTKKYCIHGVCCVIVDEERCSCERGYTEDRCDERVLDDFMRRSLSKLQFVQTVSIISVIVVVVVIAVLFLLAFFYMRVKRQRMRRRAAAAAAAATSDSLKIKTAGRLQPGFSWRQTASVRRQISTGNKSRSLSGLPEMLADDQQPLSPKSPGNTSFGFSRQQRDKLPSNGQTDDSVLV